MQMSAIPFLTTGAALVASNYVYQFVCSHPDWDAAHERSVFQVVALALTYVTALLVSRGAS